MTDSMKQYETLAAGVDGLREVMTAMVAGLVSDGFSDEQARWIVVGVFTNHLKKDTETDE